MLESSVTLIHAGVPGGWEWVIIALVVLLLFGAKRIPELARGIGFYLDPLTFLGARVIER